jgi:hypothetical protein
MAKMGNKKMAMAMNKIVTTRIQTLRNPRDAFSNSMILRERRL